MSEQITVCIADNDEDYRKWLERELGSAGDIRIAASVSDGRQALAADGAAAGSDAAGSGRRGAAAAAAG